MFPATADAGVVDLGVFSFDNLIPDGDTAGVNFFDIANFTGADWSLPPDFPVVTELTLQNVTLALDGSAGPQDFSLGDIVPGIFSPPDSIEFTDTQTFTDATLTATLSDDTLTLSTALPSLPPPTP